jgi:orotate phosphoribosyltransferase
MPKYFQRPSPTWIPINTRLKVAKVLLNDKDGTAVFSPTVHLNAANVLLDKIIENLHEAEGVVGIGITGYPLASAVAFLSIMSNFHPLDTLYLNGNCVVGHLDRKQAGIVIIKKDARKGKNLVKSVEVLRSLRYKILGVLVLVDYQEGAAQALKKKKIPFYSVFTDEEVVAEVEEWNNSITS